MTELQNLYKGWDTKELLESLDFDCSRMAQTKISKSRYDQMIGLYSELCKRHLYKKANIIINYHNINGELNVLVEELLTHAPFDCGEFVGVELTTMPKECA